jgi:hypothetical protein
VKRLAALLACAVLVAACGGAEPDEPAGRSGGTAADDRLGGEPVDDGSSLRLCDGQTVEVVKVGGGTEAIDRWRELRDDARSSGVWPVIVGAPEDAAGLAETTRFNCEDGHTFERTLARASKVDVDRARARVARLYGVRPNELRGSTRLPDEPPGDEFVVPFDLVSGEPLPEVRIALLPIEASWEATAVLPFGNYNESPAPPVHTAVLRDWSRRYGAEVVSMTADVLELAVSRPPTSDQAALALAREQFSYAPDIVQQGVGDVESLAATLKNGHAWYFWWD